MKVHLYGLQGFSISQNTKAKEAKVKCCLQLVSYFQNYTKVTVNVKLGFQSDAESLACQSTSVWSFLACSKKKNADFGFDLGDVTKGAYAPSPFRGQVLPYSNT